MRERKFGAGVVDWLLQLRRRMHVENTRCWSSKYHDRLRLLLELMREGLENLAFRSSAFSEAGVAINSVRRATPKRINTGSGRQLFTS